MHKVMCWIGILIVGSAVMAAQTLDELKQRWKAGNYSNVVSPLITLHSKVPRGSPADQEIDYMLARMLCTMGKPDGCAYCRALSGLHGESLVFDGASYGTREVAKACCPQEKQDSEEEGSKEYYTFRSRSEDEILADLEKEFAPPLDRSTVSTSVKVSAPASLVTTTLDVKRTEATLPGDWIAGFRLIEIDRANDPYFHWMVQLEVEYVYNVGHEPPIVTGEAKGGPLVSGYSTWGPGEDQPYGPKFRRVLRRLQIAIHLEQPEVAVNGVNLTLQEPLPPYRTIIGEDFPFSYTFKLASIVSTPHRRRK